MVAAVSNCIMLSWNSPPFLTFLPAMIKGISTSWSVIPHALFNATVIGCHHDNRIIIYSGLFNGSNDTSHITVQFFQLFIIARSVVPDSMTGMIQLIEANCKHGRLLSLIYFSAISQRAVGYLS